MANTFSFEILDASRILEIVPFIEKLNNFKIAKHVLEQRCLEMVEQNYECAVVLEKGILIGVCGLWYCTRHYSGRSVEVDHVYIEEVYRGKGVGKQFFKWINAHVKTKGNEALELNTYVGNTASHKFYYNEGFRIIGYHFIKNL